MSASRAAPGTGPGTASPTPEAAADRSPTDTCAIDGVTVVHWPSTADGPDGGDGSPRILVVRDEAPPPLVWGAHDDWVRAGASPAEVAARVARLTTSDPSSVAHPRRVFVAPTLDADGIVRNADGLWAAVPPVEARLLAVLLDRPGHVVHRRDLHEAAWPAGVVTERALDGRMKLLRRRIRPLGLTVHTVRGLGFLLEVGAPPT